MPLSHLAWNKGLTKDTDERIKRLADKKIGGTSWNKGLTRETDNRMKNVGFQKGYRVWNTGKHLSLEHKLAVSNGLKRYYSVEGHTSWSNGLTAETDKRLRLLGQKVSITRKGYRHSEETRWKISTSNMGHHSWAKGFHWSEETNKKNSLAHIGEKNYWFGKRGKETPWFGKKRTPEMRLKDSLAQKKYWQNITPEQKRKYFGYRISKPQQRLYGIVKQYFSDAILEYPIKTKETHRCADIGIPSLKLDFEYDGELWHKDNNGDDKKRDLELLEIGWTTFRVNSGILKNIEDDKNFFSKIIGGNTL